MSASFSVKARAPSRSRSAIPFFSYPTTSYPTTSYPTTSYPTTSYPTTSYPTTSYPASSYSGVYQGSYSSAYPIDPYMYRSGYLSGYERYQLPFQNLSNQPTQSMNNNQNNNIFYNKNVTVTNTQNNNFSF